VATWEGLLNGQRRKPSKSDKDRKEVRTPFERDFDRILFSTPDSLLLEHKGIRKKAYQAETRATHRAGQLCHRAQIHCQSQKAVLSK
jgi:hypothetical protein